MTVLAAEAATFPGARRPDRQRIVDSEGLRIAVHEWGDEGARPLLLAHGGMDFARTFDVFAPLLADAGWRVVSWDHRGHGDGPTLPGRVGGHGQPQRAIGTGTSASSSRTASTGSSRPPRSVRSMRRWVSADTATALTSSGVA